MKKLTTEERKRQITNIVAIADDQIDTSDIPELTDEQLSRAIRGRFYRPVKRPVTMRLDADVIDWLKKDGPGYQTKANRLLRAEMLRSYGRAKPVQSAGKRQQKRVRER
ncbi:MAG TPA: BrnA antitoxin family protein [Candidatus Angelobacter sp.]|nr:BrnA antitoxin family protein [Candidatus Angelobacter sp.]